MGKAESACCPPPSTTVKCLVLSCHPQPPLSSLKPPCKPCARRPTCPAPSNAFVGRLPSHGLVALSSPFRQIFPRSTCPYGTQRGGGYHPPRSMGRFVSGYSLLQDTPACRPEMPGLPCISALAQNRSTRLGLPPGLSPRPGTWTSQGDTKGKRIWCSPPAARQALPQVPMCHLQ